MAAADHRDLRSQNTVFEDIAISTRLAQEYPEPNKEVQFRVTRLRRDIANVAQRPLIVLLGAALGLLLIGCCNLVNLLLARALTRGRETAVRSALGATQARLVRQAAAELLPILALGSLLGVLAAKWGIDFMMPWVPAALPRAQEVQVNVPVLLFSGVLVFVTAALVLLLPALQVARTDLVARLREDSRTSSGTAAKATIRNLLVVGQVALTVILLTGAGLLIRTFAALKEVNPGFRPQGVLSLRLAIPRSKYAGDDQVTAFCRRILDQLSTLPGVEAAGMGNRLPLEGSSGLSSVEFERSHQEPGTLEATDDTTVTPDYFKAMGIPLLQGRSFTEQDATNAPRVVVVVRTASDVRRLVNPVLAAIKEVDPDQPAYAVRTMTEVLERSLAMRWFNTVMVSLFALSSLLLATVGIYGVIAWTVRQRTREIGVRMALGAQRKSVLALVLQHGLKLAAAGILLGLIGALVLTRLLRSLLFGVGPTDPVTFAAVPALLASAALLACFLPARRATRVDPMMALRDE